jgi:hypothetical protein
MELLEYVMKFVESLMRSGWVIVLGDSEHSEKYYSYVCGKLNPYNCISINISSGYLGFDVKLMLIRKSEALKGITNISEKDFENLYAIEVTPSGNTIRVAYKVYPDILKAVGTLIESLSRSVTHLVDRAKILEVARSLPHM